LMDTENIIPNEILIKDKNRSFHGKIVRIAVFTSNKVIHVKSPEQEDFYLIFYRNHFIYGNKLSTVEPNSFIDKVFHDGLKLESTHPILPAILPKQSVSIPNRNKLFSHLQISFSPQELVEIAVTLDSFFEKDYLVKVIDQIYFHYKRNGKFMKAFQILQILYAFMPQLKSAKDRLTSLEFNSYHHFYQSKDLSSIFEKDPLYVERYCWNNRHTEDTRLFLEKILSSKGYLPEIILLWFEKVRGKQGAESIEKYTRIAQKFVSPKEWMSILVHEKVNPFHELQDSKSVISELVSEGKEQTAALYLMTFVDDLPAPYIAILKNLWGRLDSQFVLSHLEEFTKLLQKHVLEDNQELFEEQIYQLIVNMLKEFDLKTVYDKLLPLQKELPNSDQILKLNKMLPLLEDPDRMMELGSYYADFKQYDQAIDCYYWEMELKPKDPLPVWNLSKMYQFKGMAEEAAGYQKVYAQLKNAQ
jgi:hypothetical protein